MIQKFYIYKGKKKVVTIVVKDGFVVSTITKGFAVDCKITQDLPADHKITSPPYKPYD